MRRRAVYFARSMQAWGGIVAAAILIWTTLATLVSISERLTSAFENAYYPVVTGWRAEATREPGGQTLLHVHGDKVRACKYLGEDMAVRRPDGEAQDVASAWVVDPTPGSSRRRGPQDFGLMRVFTSRATPAGVEIIGVARHQCHAGPETLTPIDGPGFVVPPFPDAM